MTVHAYLRNPERYPAKVLVPAGAYVQLTASGVVHIAKASICEGGWTVVTLCRRRVPGPGREPLQVHAYLPMPYRPCKACLRKLRRNLDRFEGGKAR